MDSIGSEYHNHSYSLPLSQTGKDVNFFDENHDIKDSRDFLYNGWPEIGNLEVVERIFRNEDEFNWFASSEDVEATLDVSNPEFQFTCSDSAPVENKSKNCCEHSVNETHLSVSDTCMKAVCSSNTEALIGQDRMFAPEVQNEILDTVHSTKDDGNEMPTHGDQCREQKDQYLVDDGGYRKSLLGKVIKKMSKGIFREHSSCMDIKQQNQPLVHKSFGHVPCNIQFTHSDYSYPSDRTSEYVIRYQTAPVIPNEKFEMLRHKEALQYIGIQVPFCSPLSTQENEFDALGDAEKVRSEHDSTTLRESSSVGSASSDELSPEAATFCQLQLVVERLDMRTKLCIRDSLYRLAKNTARRYDNGIPNQVTCGMDTAYKCTEFLNMEDDTNPIDRSIAHLLYHRPSVPPTATTPPPTPTQESSFHHNNTATAVSF